MKTKTLVVILNYNLPEYTNALYKELIKYKTDSHDIMIFDNASSPEGKPDVVHLATEKNCRFGGAMNLMFEYIIQNKEYDSLLFLSNDLLINGANFVDILRKEMFEQDYSILSPAVHQVMLEDNIWRQMLNYGTKNVRQVPWVDFMSPLIHRRVIEEIKQFDMSMIHGWGLDIYSGIICERKQWKIGIVDYISAVHLIAKTAKEGKSDVTFEEYCKFATEGMDYFFIANNLNNEKNRMMYLAQTYKP